MVGVPPFAASRLLYLVTLSSRCRVVSCTVDLMTRLGLPHQLDVPITPSRHCCRVVAVGIDTRAVHTGVEEDYGCCLRLLPCPGLGGASVLSDKRQRIQEWVPRPLAGTGICTCGCTSSGFCVSCLHLAPRVSAAITVSGHARHQRHPPQPRASNRPLNATTALPNRRIVKGPRDLWPDVFMDKLSCLSWCGESWKLVSHLIRWCLTSRTCTCMLDLPPHPTPMPCWDDGWQQWLKLDGSARCRPGSAGARALSASVLVVPPLRLQAIGCARWGELHVLDLAAIADSEADDNYQTINKHVCRFPSSISACCFLPSGQHLVCGAQDGTMLLLDHGTGLQLHSVRVHQRPITSLSFSFSQQAQLLAVGDERGFVSVWDLADGFFEMVQLCK
jgi:hypothetical protein